MTEVRADRSAAQAMLDRMILDFHRGEAERKAKEHPELHFPGGIRWLYFQHKSPARRLPFRFCYSTVRNANGKFVSWVYAPKGRNSWDYKRVVEHRRRRAARARAERLWNKARAAATPNQEGGVRA